MPLIDSKTNNGRALGVFLPPCGFGPPTVSLSMPPVGEDSREHRLLTGASVPLDNSGFHKPTKEPLDLPVRPVPPSLEEGEGVGEASSGDPLSIPPMSKRDYLRESPCFVGFFTSVEGVPWIQHRVEKARWDLAVASLPVNNWQSPRQGDLPPSTVLQGSELRRGPIRVACATLRGASVDPRPRTNDRSCRGTRRSSPSGCDERSARE